MSEMPKLLLVSEVATILRVSERTVFRLLLRGKLVGVRVGKQWRVPEQELLRVLRCGAIAATEYR